MRKLPSPRDVESRAHYARVELSSRPADLLFFKKLLPWRSADLMAWVTQAEQDAAEELGALEAKGARAQWEGFALQKQYTAAIEGRLIGLLWAHQEYDLESLDKQHATPADMGAAVWEELYEEGYTPAELSHLALAAAELCAVVAAGRVDLAEVNRLVDFGEARVSKITPTPQQVSSTSEIPAPSAS